MEPMSIAELTCRANIKRTALSRACGRHASTAYHWRVVPIQHVVRIAALTGIAPHEIRPDLPDIFPHPNKICRASAAA